MVRDCRLAMGPLAVFLALVAVASATTTQQPDDPAYELTFPEDFLFSSATASYQIEGAWNISGKGENIWDRLSHEHPELILDGSNGDVACDSYHKYKEDIRIVKELGTKVYRFSLSWSRILPTGAIDVVNEDGLRYYNAIIDECIANKIEPMISIFHWDLPQPLQDMGGFPNEVIADYFVDYADLVFEKFGDRVKWWVTVNEPWSVCADGYGAGGKAPGIKSEGRADYLCAHTVLKAHARTYHLYKDKYFATQQGKLGIAANSNFYFPKDPNNPDDVAAAKRWLDFQLGWYTHPIFSANGDYPPELKTRVRDASINKQKLHKSRLPEFTAQEVAYIKGTADFYGINTYTSNLVADAKETDPNRPAVGTRAGDCGITTSVAPEWDATIASWFYVAPGNMRGLLNWIKDEYNNPPVIITENGYPDAGAIKDVQRVNYYRMNLLEVLKAINDDKCNVIGYTTWSLMDNYEWFYGYEHKFGLYHVDFNDPDRPRIPKMSAKFYQKLISTRKVPKEGDIIFPDDTTTQAPTTKSPTTPRTQPPPASTTQRVSPTTPSSAARNAVTAFLVAFTTCLLFVAKL
ncbi:myrosinase 1-like [Thrips palmi]|uniref:Myrosinase 1-like n=1 Tax=Thrips palmi TaxID=161013 RepID=A0A6P8ZVL3_THRPL|nr:myrosinase 1-like [Thrips palmi]XP_034249180.1 myrosinase 1-like [Thrips palmi]